jgi:hypothetical protein
MRFLLAPMVVTLIVHQAAGQSDFKLAPAVAVEAEDFHIESGWKVIRNAPGNSLADGSGSNHISGERLLGLDSKNETASAYLDVTIPESGAYRLWVRYEYPPFCETRFRVKMEQDGRTVIDRMVGASSNPRYSLGELSAKPQHDPANGCEGLVEEVIAVQELKAGKARIYLRGAAQPQEPGVAAHRNVDLIYLTRDTEDTWRKHYSKHAKPYPLLEAFRDSRGPRYEVRFTNRGDQPADFQITHVYNRAPWGVSETEPVRGVAPSALSAWIPLRMQDTSHFGMVRFSGTAKVFDVEIRAIGGSVERTISGAETAHVYLPPYPGKGEKPITPEEELDTILAELKKTPAIGKKPTQPLCFGGWMPVGVESEYGRKYAELYAALGFKSLHPALSGPAALKNLRDVGIPLSKSWAASGYRNPPTRANIDEAKLTMERLGLKGQLRFYEYGDDVPLSEWMQMRIQRDVDWAKMNRKKLKPIAVLARLWFDWLRASRKDVPITEYWLDKWGPFNLTRMRPDSSAEAAEKNPRLYVDSLLFYEQTVLGYLGDCNKEVSKTFGDDTLYGTNDLCPPFSYPLTTNSVKWFRQGVADLARFSDSCRQDGQAGPMMNGYIAEHYRAGLRDNSKGALRVTIPAAVPGNSDGHLLRAAFTSLAHGATLLDFQAVGMNETFTENTIDHRAHHRYRALRDITHAVGLVEDLLPSARPLPSRVALLVSESTERWDFAGVAEDMGGKSPAGPQFRKMRLDTHLDRLGIWTALSYLGASPDLILEEDLTNKALKDYRVLILTGDCLPPQLAPSIEEWVRQGGIVLATANAGRYDPYRQATNVFEQLFGLQSRQSEERESFFRVRHELPRLKPFDRIVCPGGSLPQLGTHESIEPAEGVSVLARFASTKKPAILDRRLDKGHILYVAALPGVAFLWSGVQPTAVVDRGPRPHVAPTSFDPAAKSVMELLLRAAHIQPAVEPTSTLVDARLLKSSGGFILPIANYNGEIGKEVTLRLRIGEKIRKVTSAYHGELATKVENDRLVVTIPSLGYGDVLRLDPDPSGRHSDEESEQR